MRVLLIEDDLPTQEFLKSKLEESLFSVDIASTGTDGLAKAIAHHYDIIIADYALPGKNGFEISRTLRESGIETPIIVTTAAASITHKLLGFSVGADDYITKPFYFKELLARIRAVLRRHAMKNGDDSTRGAASDTLTFDTLSLNIATRYASRSDTRIPITNTEFLLLELLLRRPERLVTRSEMLSQIWDNAYDLKNNSIETHMTNLRQKLNANGQKNLIHCLPRRGYRLGYS